MEEPLPRYWGQDLGRAEREVRRHLYVVNGKRRRRPSWRELPEELLAPRVLVRSGLFTRTSSREAQLGVERTVPNGTSFFRGVPLRWWDLRALLAICAQSGNDGAAEMPPTRLLRSIGQGPSVRGLERARDSLQRLCSARIAFDLAGFGRVGERGRLERFLDEGEDHLYTLRPWLRQAYGARGEPRLSWPLLCKLQKGAFLLYLLLESEDWRTSELEDDPIDPTLGKCRSRVLILGAPMLTVLDMAHLADRQTQVRTLRRALGQIQGRDLRYRAYRIGRRRDDVPMVRIWRQDAPLRRENLYLGRLCSACYRPDPNKLCCCRQPRRCGHGLCPRCREP